MGRHKTIDREKVLEFAEQVVASRGAAALTIDAVAKAAGISKGGVQSTFGTKEALVAAMLERWNKSYDKAVAKLVDPEASAIERVRAHADVTHKDEDGSQERVAGLLSVLLQSPEHLESTRQWYRSRMEGLDDSPQHRAKLAFIATEGAFLLRYLGLMPMDQAEWDSVFNGIAELLQPKQS